MVDYSNTWWRIGGDKKSLVLTWWRISWIGGVTFSVGGALLGLVELHSTGGALFRFVELKGKKAA